MFFLSFSLFSFLHNFFYPIPLLQMNSPTLSKPLSFIFFLHSLTPSPPKKTNSAQHFKFQSQEFFCSHVFTFVRAFIFPNKNTFFISCIFLSSFRIPDRKMIENDKIWQKKERQEIKEKKMNNSEKIQKTNKRKQLMIIKNAEKNHWTNWWRTRNHSF